MDRDANLILLSDIIKNYRKDDLEFTIDTKHINTWLSQFSPENQDIILQETLHVFKNWYFSNEYVDEKIDMIPDYLLKKYDYQTIHSVCDSVCFFNVQKDGKSQHTMISRFAERMRDRYNISIKTNIEEGIKHYIYFDDGLYTGSRSRKDLNEIIINLPKDSTLEVCYIVACESAFSYTKNIISRNAEQHGITLFMTALNHLYDVTAPYYGKDGSENHNIHYDCLWPMPYLENNEHVNAYVEKLNIRDNAKKYLFRKSNWSSDAGIFSSAENRAIVEKEFLIHGIKILEKITEEKGIYPLGYSVYPSLGLGSFCAFDMNISNTCPLVLWWGNNSIKGNVLDNWYPLLPRRVNQREKTKSNCDDMIFLGEKNTEDKYNMCPDCGRHFGLEKDGGNGFCIDCAWKH